MTARRKAGWMALAVAALIPIVSSSPPAAAMPIGRLPAGSTLRIAVPEAVGGKTVVGQLTVDRAVGLGFVTAFGCDDGIPTNPDGAISRSDLNVNGAVSPVASNRLIVQADYSGNVCFYTEQPAALIVDVNGVTFDTGVNSFANRRTDMRQTATPRLAAGGVLRVSVPEAAGAKTVVGQLTVDQVATAGFVTAYACASGIPTNRDGSVGRSDLNFDGTVSPVASNRLIVQADERGDVCFYAEQPAALVVDVNGVSDVGISSLPNRRTDTRPAAQPRVAAGGVLRVSVPEAAGHRTVVGQLTVDRASSAGFVTGYGCDDGVPGAAEGSISRSDLNFDARVSPVASNRLIVQADADGDVCFFAEQPVAMIVDVNAVSVAGINSFTNHRTDTRVDELPAGSVTTIGVPVWHAYTPKPALDGVAALTGAPADSTITNRPILAVKIDNYGKARPQWALDQADAVIEENAEGISRFVALFHTRLPDVVGPVRSARTADLDLLAAMNRPVFAYSGGNPGVYAWIGSAAMSGVLVDFGAQSNGCYRRSPDRPGPHNLLLDPSCALARSPVAGPARQLWSISPAGGAANVAGGTTDTSFGVAMDGVAVGWTWDATSGTYLRSQDGAPHLAESGAQISARNVVVLSVAYVPSPVDARSPSAVTLGTGTGVVHRDGWAVAVVWSRDAPEDPFAFTDAATGQPVLLGIGTTFVELQRGA